MFSPFLINAFAWNFALGMNFLLLPLYALELGLSGLQIGSLIGLPIVLQVAMNLTAGSLVDRFGAKSMSVIAPVITAAAAGVYTLADSFTGLLAGQVLYIASRAIFWPANWALATQIPPRPGDGPGGAAAMGRLNSSTSAGQIAGIAASGMVVTAIGLRNGFWVMGAVALSASLFASAIVWNRPKRERPADAAPRSWLAEALGTYRTLARIRPMYLGMLCAFVAGIPFTLSSSFYPVLLVELGFSSEASGWLLSVRAVGAVFAGILLAKWIRSAHDWRVPIACGLVIAATVGLMPVSGHGAVITVLLAAIGVASSLLTVYFQLSITEASGSAQRGSAMAFGGLGWQMCNLLIPPAMGALRDSAGIATAFYAAGAAMFIATLAILRVHRWALAGTRPAAR